jgi:hypothetical protein
MSFNDSVRIRLSFGLLAAAIVQAVIFGAFVYLAQVQPVPSQPGLDLRVPRDGHGEMGAYESLRPLHQLQEPPNVNLAAQGEMKQAGPCLPCNQTRRPAFVQTTGSSGIHLNPGERLLSVGPERTVTHQPAVSVDTVLHQPVYRTVTPVTVAQPQAPKKATQVALFLDASPQAKQLLEWFETDPYLRKVREISDFQVYTPQNALYRARFASIVPVDQFPTVLFLDARGGHIHAAGRSSIPTSSTALFEDFREGWKLYKEAKSGTVEATGVSQAGALKTRGYSWDDAINPAMKLQASDCNDGSCDPGTGWRPGSKLDDFFNGSGGGLDPRAAFLWANANEIGTVFLMLVAGALLVYILAKRSRV